MDGVEGSDPMQLVWMNIVVFLDISGIALVVPLLPAVAKELEMSYLEYGLVSSVYGVAQVISNPAMGALSDVRGRKVVLLASMVGAAVAYMLFGIAGSIRSVTLLLVSRVLVGLVKQTMTISTAFVTDNTTPEGRTRALGYLHATSRISFIVGAAVGGALSAQSFTLLPAYASSVMYAIAFVICLVAVKDAGGSLGKKQVCPALAAMGRKPSEYENKEAPHPIPESVTSGPLVETLVMEFKGLLSDMRTNPRVLEIAIASALSQFSLNLVQTSFSVMTQERFGLSVKHNGYLIAYHSLLNALAMILVVRFDLSKRTQLPVATLLSGAALVSGVSLLLQARVSSLQTLMALMVVGALGESYSQLFLSSSFTLLYEAEIGAAQGLFSNIDSLSRIFSPMLSGALLHYGGVGTPWTVAGCLMVLMGAYTHASFSAPPSKDAARLGTKKRD